MSDQPSDLWQTPPREPAPETGVDTSEPLTAVQTQIGLLLTASATVVTFIWHKDFSSIVPALSVIAFAIYGAAAAIARAWKHSTVVKAQTQTQALQLDAWATRQNDKSSSMTSANVVLLDQRLRAVESALAAPAKTTAAKKTTPRRGSRT